MHPAPARTPVLPVGQSQHRAAMHEARIDRWAAPHAAWRWYRTDDDGVVSLDRASYLADRGTTVDLHMDLACI